MRGVVNRKPFRAEPCAAKDAGWQTVEQGLGEMWGWDDHVRLGKATPQTDPPKQSHVLLFESGDRSPAWPSRGVRRDRLGVRSPELGGGWDAALSKSSNVSKKALGR
jgi:hypothetical protein